MELGNRIAEIRKDHNLTQERLAEICSVTRQTISNWENSKSYPDLETLVLISDTFDVSLDAMMKGDRQMVSEITKEQKQVRRSKIVMIIAIGILLLVIGAEVYLHLNDGNTKDVYISDIDSEVYTEEDYDEAVSVVLRYFSKHYKGCEMIGIWYLGDDKFHRMKEREKMYGVDEAIVLMSAFSTGSADKLKDHSLNENTVYSGWSWTLVRNTGGKWILKDAGYGNDF